MYDRGELSIQSKALVSEQYRQGSCFTIRSISGQETPSKLHPHYSAEYLDVPIFPLSFRTRLSRHVRLQLSSCSEFPRFWVSFLKCSDSVEHAGGPRSHATNTTQGYMNSQHECLKALPYSVIGLRNHASCYSQQTAGLAWCLLECTLDNVAFRYFPDRLLLMFLCCS